jgi:hypothetical protein
MYQRIYGGGATATAAPGGRRRMGDEMAINGVPTDTDSSDTASTTVGSRQLSAADFDGRRLTQSRGNAELTKAEYEAGFRRRLSENDSEGNSHGLAASADRRNLATYIPIPTHCPLTSELRTEVTYDV